MVLLQMKQRDGYRFRYARENGTVVTVPSIETGLVRSFIGLGTRSGVIT
ncbi:hypothetical protein AtNW77_Chr1g0071441 [Arabidopsis thaliana]